MISAASARILSNNHNDPVMIRDRIESKIRDAIEEGFYEITIPNTHGNMQGVVLAMREHGGYQIRAASIDGRPMYTISWWEK